jgi:hypothetical protein
MGSRRAIALNAALSGAILAQPEAYFVTRMAFPFGTTRALDKRLAFHGTNGAPAPAVGYCIHTSGVEQSDLPKTGAFDKIMFRYS